MKKKSLYFRTLLIMVLFTSCIQIVIHNADKNKTKKVLYKKSLHLFDTLYIIEPFTKVYIRQEGQWDDILNKRGNEYLRYGYYGIYNQSKPYFYWYYPPLANKVKTFVKTNYEQYLTCFNYKKEIQLTIEDSVFISKQMDKLKQLLKDSSIQQLPIPDSLYNRLIKYGRSQFLITDIMEFYKNTDWFTSGNTNIYWYHRFFIIDIVSKQLSFYDYHIDGAYAAPINYYALTASEEKLMTKYYTSGRSVFYKKLIKKYNRKIRRGYPRRS